MMHFRNASRPNIGFDEILLKSIYKEGCIDCHSHQVMIILDEMKVRGIHCFIVYCLCKMYLIVNCVFFVLEELVFQSSTNKFIGFVDLAENRGTSQGGKQILATNALGIYVKGITTIFLQAYCYKPINI